MAPKTTNFTIMIIDDDSENLRVLGTILSQQGFTVRSLSADPWHYNQLGQNLPT